MSIQQTTPEAVDLQAENTKETMKIEGFLDKCVDATIRAEMEREVADRYQAYAVRRRPGCQNPEEVKMRIAAGRAFGLDRDSSLASFDVIEGVVAMRAHFRAARLQEFGWHWVFVKHDAMECSLIATQNGQPYLGADGNPHVFRYTIEQAKTAGLEKKNNWQKNAEDMLFARAITRVQRRVCPAATLGQDIPDTTEAVTLDAVISQTQADIRAKSNDKLAALAESMASAEQVVA